jgi:thiol-disulfide isomerase/thioredoxin
MQFKKIFTLLILSTFIIINCNAQSEITIKMDGYTKGGVAKLIGVFGDQNYLADSAVIDNTGKCVFKNKDTYKTGLFYLLFPNNTNLQLIFAADHKFSLETKMSNIVGEMVVKNSLDNEILYKHLKFQASYFEPKYAKLQGEANQLKQGSPEWTNSKSEIIKLLAEKESLISELRTKYPKLFYSKFKLSGQNPKVSEPLKSDGKIDTAMQLYQFKSRFWEEMDFTDENMLNTPVFFNKLNKYMKELTPQNPDSILKSASYIIDKSKGNKELFKFTANWIAIQYQPTKTTVMDGEAIYAPLIEKYFTRDQAFWSDSAEISNIRKSAIQMKSSYIGKIGQNVWGNDVNGSRKEFYDLKSKIKVLFIYNPDCEHCQEQAPQLRKIYDEYKSKGVGLFSIATQGDYDKWKAFGPKYGVNWTDVTDPNLDSNYHLKYYVDITPEIYVLNENNIIVAKNLKAPQLPLILDRELLKLSHK